MSGRHVAIVGATGAVGAELLDVLEGRDFPVASLRLLASPRSAGRRLRFRGDELPVQPLDADAFAGIDVAFFSAGSAASRELAPLAAGAGAVVIDNSSAFRLDPQVPLVVPECNAAAIADRPRGIVANPNCSTILMVLVLAPLHAAAGLRRVVVATYQAASGAGARAIDELHRQTRAVLDGEPPPPPRTLPDTLGFNLFPQVDVFGGDGYTREEDKMRDETRKILGIPDLAVEATCVRVPVERCHSEALAIELARPLGVARARRVLAAAVGLEVVDEPAAGRYPTPLRSSGRDPVAVGRIRESRVFEHGLALWLAGDQLRKGAALNAVQIAENL